MTPASLLDAARELARMSRELTGALEAGDLDGAERLVTERGRLLQSVLAASTAVTPADSATLASARAAVLDADGRSVAALGRVLDEARSGLATLGEGARAVRAYLPSEPLAAGWVDRRD